MFRSFLSRVQRHLQLSSQESQYAASPSDVVAANDEDGFYPLAACLIFKNEAVYLKEWLDFHRLVGVEKFFLYNNASEDNYKTVLQPYIEKGIVALHDFPMAPPNAQTEAYNLCLKTHRRHARWIAFIDID